MRRLVDSPWVRQLDSFRQRHGHTAMYVIITLAFLFAMERSNEAQHDSARAARATEAVVREQIREKKAQDIVNAQRRNENCKVFEGDHLDDVNQLKATYGFLSNPKTNHSELALAVLPGLPALEAKARKDPAPDYCDEPGVQAETLWRTSHHKQGAPPIGNPEPDPVLPKHRDFSYLLKP